MGNVSSRNELWGPAKAQPEPHSDKRDASFWKPKDVMPFDPKINGHLPINPKKPFRIPDGYSAETLRRGFEATTTLRKNKALADMANSPSRDNLMYQHLDSEYIIQMKKEQR